MKTVNDYALHLGNNLCGEMIRGNDLVGDVTCDSRDIKPAGLFCAIKGVASNGHDYIGQAIDNGATAVIHSEDLENYDPEISYLKVDDSYLAYAMACELFYHRPAKEFRLHGITGTNGKTTIAFLLEHILSSNKRKTGLITTVECRNGSEVIPSMHTTPEAKELQKTFRAIADNDCSDVVMEVSSHGLDQYRPGSTKFSSVIFTNLTGDHLDYHKDMENYYQAKKRLFSFYLASYGSAVINVDDEYGRRLSGELEKAKIIRYGQSPEADCKIVNLHTTTSGSSFDLLYRDKVYQINSNLIGEYNAYNSCAAFCAAVSSGINAYAAAQSLSDKIKVPGRLEYFRDPRGVTYFVDYAHTDDALRNVLKNLRHIAPARILTVFGCGGNRDRSKRPRMAEAASEFSNLLIITSDNPRNENPLDIIDEVRSGVPDSIEYRIEPDRRKAIKLASESANEGDIVLIAGKGHENYQEIEGKFFDFDDRKIILGICAT